MDCMYSPWGCKELDTTERLSLTTQLFAYIGLDSWVYLYLYFGLESNTTLFCSLNCFSFGHCELFQLVPVFL